MTGSLASDNTLYMTLTNELPAFLNQSLLQCKNLPSLPSVALRVLEVARSSRSTLNDYVKAIEHDPALTLRLIAFANSAYYAQASSSAQTCLDAVQRLGLDATLAVILGFSLFQHATEAPYHNRTWQRAITAALIARYLAEQECPEQSGSAFTTALLQDIGILALQSVYPDEAKTLYAESPLSEPHAGLSRPDLLKDAFHTEPPYAESPHAELVRAEQRYFGCDHALVGAWLAAKWGVPDNIVNAIHQSHESFLLNDKLLLCIRLSGPIADAWLSRNPASQLAALLYQLKTVSYTYALRINEVLHNVQKQTDIIANALNMTAPVKVDSTTLLADAHQLLFQHTLTLSSQLEDQKQALVSLRCPDVNQKEHSLRDASLHIHRSGLISKPKNR
ncbi:HDOD domain-containing protein [Vreelandella nanhaiensis]|uniref:HDOD domain-containing protein n=1 Tax=Vreelandella nanhaiensis TaxID=1258546 RepID=A0A433KU54_9GAMM|nr:HDOD domain-containing protein [Halomonas nanhaiensis]RUR33186.1 HDOD domain-containing protein [Halomonas nanhaiensis]